MGNLISMELAKNLSKTGLGYIGQVAIGTLVSLATVKATDLALSRMEKRATQEEATDEVNSEEA